VAQSCAAVRQFKYETVFAGSLRGRFCAAMLNSALGAVIVNEGLPSATGMTRSPALPDWALEVGPERTRADSSLRAKTLEADPA